MNELGCKLKQGPLKDPYRNVTSWAVLRAYWRRASLLGILHNTSELKWWGVLSQGTMAKFCIAINRENVFWVGCVYLISLSFSLWVQPSHKYFFFHFIYLILPQLGNLDLCTHMFIYWVKLRIVWIYSRQKDWIQSIYIKTAFTT